MEMQPLIVGAVAYDAKVVPIWEGIRDYFRDAPVEMDVVWFSNYEAQVEALLAGFVDVAWNTNLAYARTHHATEGACRALAMRDTDVGFTTFLVSRSGELTDVQELAGKTLAIGSADSAQAAIMPLFYLARAGLRPGEDLQLVALRHRRRQARRHRHERAGGVDRGARRPGRRRRGRRRGVGRARARWGRASGAPVARSGRLRRTTTATSRSSRPSTNDAPTPGPVT